MRMNITIRADHKWGTRYFQDIIKNKIVNQQSEENNEVGRRVALPA